MRRTNTVLWRWPRPLPRLPLRTRGPGGVMLLQRARADVNQPSQRRF